ncbi:MAG: hypothetical protein IPH20_02960 [Bacteroidales bacterium]|nr:hypothetical protein [Bacteroidales bacterium]
MINFKSMTNRSGYLAAIFLSFLFILWIVCFAGIVITSPLFMWTNLEDYIRYVRTNNQFFQNFAKVLMLLFGPAWVVLINSFYQNAMPENKANARLSLLFGLAFALFISVHYFIQLSTVRLGIASNNTDGLLQLVQANPVSAMSAVNMLGWTFFMGLSSLYLFLSIKDDRKARTTGYAFLANACVCLTGGLSFLLQIDIMTFLLMNPGLGGSVIFSAIASAGFFRKMEIV